MQHPESPDRFPAASEKLEPPSSGPAADEGPLTEAGGLTELERELDVLLRIQVGDRGGVFRIFGLVSELDQLTSLDLADLERVHEPFRLRADLFPGELGLQAMLHPGLDDVRAQVVALERSRKKQ